MDKKGLNFFFKSILSIPSFHKVDDGNDQDDITIIIQHLNHDKKSASFMRERRLDFFTFEYAILFPYVQTRTSIRKPERTYSLTICLIIKNLVANILLLKIKAKQTFILLAYWFVKYY